jgi:hypothetical protein
MEVELGVLQRQLMLLLAGPKEIGGLEKKRFPIPLP